MCIRDSENDIPVVTFLEPTENIKLNEGESRKFRWKAEDLNLIENYKVYYTKNVSDKSSWTLLKTLSYKYDSIIIYANNFESGKYFLVVEATDNQNPPGIGKGSSKSFTIVRAEKEDDSDDIVKPDDGRQIESAYIDDLTPSKGSTVKTLRPKIGGRLYASKESSIDKEKITFKLNDKDVPDYSIVEHNKSEFEIIYRPKEDLEEAEHKVFISFTDENKSEAKEEWTFKIEIDDDEDIDTWNIFGYEIAKRTALIIIGILLILILLAIFLPILILNSGNDDDDYSTYTSNQYYPPTTPTSTSTSSAFKKSNTDKYYSNYNTSTSKSPTSPTPIASSRTSTSTISPTSSSTPTSRTTTTYTPKVQPVSETRTSSKTPTAPVSTTSTNASRAPSTTPSTTSTRTATTPSASTSTPVKNNASYSDAYKDAKPIDIDNPDDSFSNEEKTEMESIKALAEKIKKDYGLDEDYHPKSAATVNNFSTTPPRVE